MLVACYIYNVVPLAERDIAILLGKPSPLEIRASAQGKEVTETLAYAGASIRETVLAGSMLFLEIHLP